MTQQELFAAHFEIVGLAQGTPEWLDWRDEGIGASDAPAVMGENPWKSRTRLMEEKLSRARGYTSPAMRRGSDLEGPARERYVVTTGRAVAPCCLQSTRFAWLRASLDGLSDDGRHVVEIKCGEKVHAHAARSNTVPSYYVGQLQHILAVTGLAEIDFWCHLPERDDVHLRVPRDGGYIERLLAEEERFWRELTAARAARAIPALGARP
jgi:putative phage-type endonuclease